MLLGIRGRSWRGGCVNAGSYKAQPGYDEAISKNRWEGWSGVSGTSDRKKKGSTF